MLVGNVLHLNSYQSLITLDNGICHGKVLPVQRENPLIIWWQGQIENLRKNALISTRWAGKVDEQERCLGLMTRSQPQMQQMRPDLEDVMGRITTKRVMAISSMELSKYEAFDLVALYILIPSFS